MNFEGGGGFWRSERVLRVKVGFWSEDCFGGGGVLGWGFGGRSGFGYWEFLGAGVFGGGEFWE